MKTIPNDKVDPSIKGALEKLVDIDLDYCVSGGLLCQHYLGEHARYTKDIDILFHTDQEEVKEKLKEAFGDIDFFSSEETDHFYEPTFTCFTKMGGLRGQIEGKKLDFFSEIKTEQYSYEGIVFRGVCLEFPIAEKLVALLSELARPYKHLVDIYSFSRIDPSLINKEEIKRYVGLINAQENRYRKKAGLPAYEIPDQIPKNKVLTPPVIFPTLQSKHNVSKEGMIEAVNAWLKNL